MIKLFFSNKFLFSGLHLFDSFRQLFAKDSSRPTLWQYVLLLLRKILEFLVLPFELLVSKSNLSRVKANTVGYQQTSNLRLMFTLKF